jgi:hypothetical protein
VRERGGALGVVVDPLFHYERLLKATATSPLPARGQTTEQRQVLLEFGDIDIDIRTAVRLAELEQLYGIRTSYYVLHTSPYYGSVEDGVFKRNECMAHVYRYIESLGHEIALHTDALHLYQEHRLDGAAAVRDELAWLRSEGRRSPARPRITPSRRTVPGTTLSSKGGLSAPGRPRIAD